MRTLTLLLVCLMTRAAAQDTWIQTSIRDSVLSIDSDGRYIWVGTERGGLKRYDPEDGSSLQIDRDQTVIKSLDFRAVRCGNGNVYAGTYGDGLYILSPTAITHYDSDNSDLPGNIIRDILFDSLDNSIWLATDKGLTQYIDDTWIVYDSIIDGIKGTYINCLHQSADGTLWVGTRYNGLTKLKDGIAENYNYNNSGLNDNMIRDIAEDPYGMLYVVNNIGINTYEIATDYWLFVYTAYTAPLSSDRINQIGFDAAETFWIVTHNGITRADSANYWTQFYTDNSFIPHNTCDALYIDANNRVYVGSYGGLIYYDTPTLNETTLEIQMYPMPAYEQITITFDQQMGIAPRLDIFSTDGRKIKSLEGNASIDGQGKYTIDVQDLPSGVYILRVQSGSVMTSAEFVKV